MHSHLLSWIIFSPSLGALLILLLPCRLLKAAKPIALLSTLSSFSFCFLALRHFDTAAQGFQLIEKAVWIPQIAAYYHLGVDSLSFPMVFLSALLSLLACAASWSIRDREKEYFAFFLLLETGMMGTFLSLDLLLFYTFWEVVLIPMFFLIGIWGGTRKEKAAMKFFLYTLAGSLLMLLGILMVYFAAAPHMLGLPELTSQDSTPAFQKIAFLAFFFGFAVKVPIFPFHTWLPEAHVEAPTPISILLAGVLLKMGAYGFLRFSYPLFPAAAREFQPLMEILAITGIIYGGLAALAQTDFKKMVAYSSVSHMGFVLLGLASLNADGFRGAVLQMFNHGLITAGLFLLVGVLYDRAHTRDMTSFGGVGVPMPVYAGFLIFFSMASLGLPGLSGFIGEFLILLGNFHLHKGMAAAATLGILLAAGYFLIMIQRLLLGPLNEKWKSLPDISGREIGALLPLTALILVIGIYPSWLVNFTAPSLDALLKHLGVPLP